MIEQLIGYHFVQPWGLAVLEEALESPGSGVMTVGGVQYLRRTQEGNKSFAKVGEAVMLLVLQDQCYGFSCSEGMSLYLDKKLPALTTKQATQGK